MNDHITLYRGDATKIDSFQTKKTSTYGLLGQGIYLTDRKGVAETYREKGSLDSSTKLLFWGPAANRLEAYKLACESFVDWNTTEYRWWLPQQKKNKKQAKVIEARRKELTAEYYRLVEDKQIVAEYEISGSERKLRVTWHRNVVIGFITEFKFLKTVFEPTVFDLGCIRDPIFWELMWIHQVDGIARRPCQQYSLCHDYVRDNIGRSFGYIVHNCNTQESALMFQRIATILQPYGYRGFEYPGGYITGSGRHRAFCMWDDDFVNEHKVRRIR